MSGTAWRRSPLPPDWQDRRVAVLERDEYTCRLRYTGCTLIATEVDHVVGHDDHRLSNLQAVCHTCHATKTGRDAQAARPRVKRDAEPHPGRLGYIIDGDLA